MKPLWKYVLMVLLPFMHFTRRNLEILLNLTLVNIDRKRFKLNSCLPPNLKLWQPLRSNPFDVAKSSFLGRAMPFYCRLSKLRAQAARHVSISLEHFISLPVHEMSIDIPPSVYIRYKIRGLMNKETEWREITIMASHGFQVIRLDRQSYISISESVSVISLDWICVSSRWKVN